MTRTGRLRVALFGTPSFALPTLELLFAQHQLLLLVAQPDRPSGRGQRLSPPATVLRARALGVPVAQPPRLRRATEFQAQLRELDLDVAVTAAYGQILPAPLLAIPRHGFLNVHASLLPRWRGAAPVQHALIAGDKETGVSIMQTDPGLDTGPVRLVRRLDIEGHDDAPRLLARLADLGADALDEALARLMAGQLPSDPQPDVGVTLAPRLQREDGRVRWGETAQAIHHRHRGVAGWPGSWCTLPDGGVLKIHALDLPNPPCGGLPGTICAVDPAGLTVACGEGAVRLLNVQAPNRGRVGAHAWALGARLGVGDRLA
jgi:methionyl-tRNA formyltransferase